MESRCYRCLNIKPNTQFFYNGKRSTGCTWWCKDCYNLHMKCRAYLQSILVGAETLNPSKVLCHCLTCTNNYKLVINGHKIKDTTKTCSKCKTTKQISDFWKNYTWCKACKLNYDKN